MKAASCRSQASSSTKNLSAMGCLLSLPFDYVSAQCAEGGNLAMVASAADAAREAACADGGGNLAPAVPVQVRLQDLCCHAPRFWLGFSKHQTITRVMCGRGECRELQCMQMSSLIT